MGCIPISADAKKIGEALKGSIAKWSADGLIRKATADNWSYFKDVYFDVTGKDFDFGELPSLKDVKNLDHAIKKYSDNIKKIPTPLGTQFKLPEVILKKNPITKSFFQAIDIASNHYRGKIQEFGSNFDHIVRLLNDDMGLHGVSRRFGMSTKKASKKLAELEATYKKLSADGVTEASEKYYNENLRDLTKDSELATFENFYRLVTNPKAIFTQKSLKGAPENFTVREEFANQFTPGLVEAAKLWHEMSPKLWGELVRGIDYYADVIKANSSSYSGLKEISKKIDRLKDIKYEENYFPTQILEIFPTLRRVTEDIYSGRADKNMESLGEYVDNMIADVEKKLSVPGSIFEKSTLGATRISKNVPAVLDSYIKNVTRFNYTSKATSELTKALKKLSTLEGGVLEKQAEYLSKYITDMHSTVLGLNIKDSKLGYFARAMTSYQFMSKLGLNVRTAARNATQSLQNWVYFGGRAIWDTMNYQKSDAFKKSLDAEMKLHGVYFVNLEELAVANKLLPKVREVDGRLVEDSASMADQFSEALESIAKFTGKPMQWVENKVNRSLTFKIAFTQQYRALKDNPALLRRAVSKDKSLTEEQIAESLHKTIVKKSGRFAANMVKELHYNYDPWAKPKIMQTPVGAVLGQFQTYSINFFEYQRKIAAQGGSKMLAREWNSPEAWRLYRLGMLYAGINGVLSPFFGVDFGNLVENATLDEIGAITMYLSSPEVENYAELLKTKKWKSGVKKDKPTVPGVTPKVELTAQDYLMRVGDIFATELGGPTVSDFRKAIRKLNTDDGIGRLINLGNLNSINNMSLGERTAYTLGYRDLANRVEDDSAISEVLSFLNTQLYRTWNYTIPRWIGGASPATLGFNELGIYQTKKAKEGQRAMFDFMNKNAPHSIGKWFVDKKLEKKKNQAWKKFMSGKNPKASSFSDDEMKSIMESLDSVKSYER